MRRPLLIACLCLVIAIAIGRKLTGADTGSEGALPPDGSPVRITGRIDTRTSETIILSTISIIQNDQKYSYSGKLQCELTNTQETLKIGQQIILEGTFTQFNAATNPGEFDVQAYYAGKGIGGRVRKAQALAAGENYSHFREVLYRCRLAMHDRLARVLPAKEASVMQTLLLGEKEELDADVKALYQRNGIAHILSISGLHITLLGMGLYRLLKRIGAPVRLAATGGVIILLMYGMMVGMSVSASRAIGMYLLQMLGVFVGRTYDMLTGVGLLAAVLVLQEPQRLGDVSFLMSFGAVLGICLLTPVLARGKGDIGRDFGEVREALEDRQKNFRMPAWLRTVGGILGDSDYERNKYREGWRKVLYDRSRRTLEAGKSGFATSAGVSLFTLPIQLWFFYEIPVYSVLLNLLVLPFMSVVMAAGILSLIPGFGIAGTADCLILWWYEWICGQFGELPGAVWCVGRPAVWQMVVYYTGMFLLILVRNYKRECEKRRIYKTELRRRGGQQSMTAHRNGFQSRTAIIIICGFLIFLLTGNFDHGSRVTFLDVGQGDGIVVETAQRTYLFDCGSTSRKKIGEYVLKPYLKSRGITTLGGVFVSHPDEDHMNGVLELLENGKDWGIRVEQLFLPVIRETDQEEAFAQLLAASECMGVPVNYIKCGDEIQDRQLRLLCLHPENNTSLAETNAYSECFYAEMFAGDRKHGESMGILLTGDVEGEGERQLVQELQALSGHGFSGVDLLKVAHHGSGYSTGSEFLTISNPTAAIISCGRNNTYGHPHAETLQRLEDAAVPWYCTMDYGALTATMDRDGKMRLHGYQEGK